MSNQIQWYDVLSKYLSGKPESVKGLFNIETNRWARYLLRVLMGCFDVRIPDWWSYNYTMVHILLDGYIGITETEYGVQALKCGFSGQNFREEPTELNFAVPVLGSFKRNIDENCVLLRLQYDYLGVGDIIYMYAHQLAQTMASIDVNLMNTRVAGIGYAENKQQADTMKSAYDKITRGEPLVVMRPSNSVQRDSGKAPWFFNNVKETYICDKIEELKRNIKEDFLSEIGINTINNRKSERMLVDEVNANNQEIETAAEHWQRNLSDGCSKINKMFNIDVEIKVRKLNESENTV